MQQKFNVGFCTFSYGGNGGISSEVPDLREWLVPLIAKLSTDPRVDQIRMWNLADTPITMTRNRCVMQAREFGIDVLVMIDSDMKPDMLAGQPDAKPFFDTSFQFLIDHYHKGPCVIGAPYCGPPPAECVYIFRWQNAQSEHPNPDFQLEMYDRHTAAKMAGIQECAALPTGLIMYDIRAFELIEPKKEGDKPFFYYEWKDIYATDKASTEDVTNTRDISLTGIQKLGYNPVYCNWDAWAGHWKPKCVGKPQYISASGVSHKLKDCWEAGVEDGVKLIDFKSPASNHMLSDRMSDYVRLSDGDRPKMEWLRGLMDKSPPGVFLEVGNREGGSLLLAMEHQNSRRVIGVDPYGGLPYTVPPGAITNEYDDAMHARMLEAASRSCCFHKLTHHKMTSDEYMRGDTEAHYAFVYLDGSHSPDVVAREIAHFLPRLAHGGIIAVDDTETLPPSILLGWTRDRNRAWRMASFGPCQIS